MMFEVHQDPCAFRLLSRFPNCVRGQDVGHPWMLLRGRYVITEHWISLSGSGTKRRRVQSDTRSMTRGTGTGIGDRLKFALGQNNQQMMNSFTDTRN